MAPSAAASSCPVVEAEFYSSERLSAQNIKSSADRATMTDSHTLLENVQSYWFMAVYHALAQVPKLPKTRVVACDIKRRTEFELIRATLRHRQLVALRSSGDRTGTRVPSRKSRHSLRHAARNAAVSRTTTMRTTTNPASSRRPWCWSRLNSDRMPVGRRRDDSRSWTDFFPLQACFLCFGK